LPSNNKDTSELAALLDAAVDAIITIDKNAKIQTTNKSAKQLFGYSEQEFIGRNIKFLMPEPWASEHDGYIHNYNTTRRKKIIGIGREVQGMRKDGSTFPMHLSVSEYKIDGQMFYTGIIHDITARKNAEISLHRAQKMETIGQLTGGIAHDFNNLLTVIIGNLELLEMQLDDAGTLELLKEAQDAAEMSAELTNRLLAFARRSLLEPEVINIDDLFQTLRPIINRSLGGMHSIKINIAPDIWATKVDVGQIESAIVNLAVNAHDAIDASGTLIIEANNFIIEDGFEIPDVDLKPGEYICLSVSDTGSGMSPEVIEKAFDPFFTTKEVGKGTGLGLSMVYGFCKQSGGTATIYSEVGFGTTVNLYLPKHHVNQDIPTVLADQFDQIQKGRNQLILIVEDDEKVRRLTVKRMEALSYKVIEAENGTEAQKVLESTLDIELVFTDLVMPGGISGYELAEYVKQTYPEIKVLLTSGYAEDLVHGNALSDLSIRLLRKPYRQSELAVLLYETLQSTGG
jgi:PAS domain S-box-containing protein